MRRAADPKTKQKLGAAAVAAGTDVQGLLDMAADSGIAAPPPPDGVTEVLTFEELGAELQAQMPDAREQHPSWFRGLTPSQQDALLARLAAVEHRHPAALATTFEVPLPRLMKAIRRASERRGEVAIGARLSTIVGGLIDDAVRAQEGLVADGKWKDFFEVRLKLTSKLQDLGIVFRAPLEHQHKVTHDVDENAREELSKMLDLERKQLARNEEIKLASAQIVDVVPEVK